LAAGDEGADGRGDEEGHGEKTGGGND
jgi:hypothetical protein